MNIEELIKQADPARISTVARADSPQARHTLARVLAEPGLDGNKTGRYRAGLATHRPGTRLKPGVALAAVGAAGALAFVVTQVLPGSPSQRGQNDHHNSPSTILGALAVVAAAQPSAHPPGPGQFQYTDEKSLNSVDTINSPTTSFSVNYSERRQIWIAQNGSGRIVESFTDPRFPTAHDRRGWIRAGRPSLRIPPSDGKFGRHQLTLGPTNLFKLPTNPDRLAALLFARKIEGGPPGAAEDFVQIGDLFRETDAPPALRAALFKVAARLPGAKVLRSVTDQAGRTGVGIAYWHHLAHRGQIQSQVDESILIFNRKTSGLIAEEVFVTYTKTNKTTLSSWTVYLKSGVVNSITSTTPLTDTRNPGPA